jgi:ABC-type glycerol-3-phosphate transport system substrate-binding protein
MGDWAGGEFAVAGMKAGEDYDCLPGLGLDDVLDTGGDVFYFPKNADSAVTKAQLEMASMMVSKEVQVAFNLKKGSLPMRADVDLAAVPHGVTEKDADMAGQSAFGRIVRRVDQHAQIGMGPFDVTP